MRKGSERQLTLLSTAILGVDPKPCAVAPSRRARRHVCRNLEIGEPGPDTGVVHAEDGKVFWLNGRDVGLVGDGESTSGQIVESLEEKVRRCQKAREGKLTLAATKISHGFGWVETMAGLTVNGGQGGAWTGIVTLPDVTARGGSKVGSGALVAGELGGGRLTGREFEEIAGVGWIAEMAVEPPLVKSVIGEGSDGPVVVRESLSGDVESVHARVHDSCEKAGE